MDKQNIGGGGNRIPPKDAKISRAFGASFRIAKPRCPSSTAQYGDKCIIS